MIVRYNSKIQKMRFDGNYLNFVIDQLKVRNILTESEVYEISFNFREKFSEFVGIFLDDMGIVLIFSEEELQTIFENFVYIIGYYMYENIDDIYVSRAYIEDFSKKSFDEAVAFYNKRVLYMQDTLKTIEKQCEIPLIRLKFYLDRLISGVKQFNIHTLFGKEIINLSEISLDDGETILDKQTKLPEEFYYFSLEQRAVGFYDNLLLVNKIKAQFELFSKFDPKRLSEIFINLPFDYSPNGKMVLWNDLLTPVMLQLIFCNEYSTLSVYSLKLDSLDFAIILKEAAGYLYRKDDIVDEFYIVEINRKKLMQEVEEKLKELEYEVRNIYDITSLISKFKKHRQFDGVVEAPKELVDKSIEQIMSSELTYQQREYLNTLFARLTKNTDVRRIEKQLGIHEEYEESLKKKLIDSNLFKQLSYPTREYLKSRFPSISNKIKDYFERRLNYFCVIDE